ncbi:uncharacterized protein LOC123405968 [Hordeum vulgare subsp. vulgare]|uniref:uncharacterized protein LOC123405968 n=1 Tax=Hordeum vulgare subsp. vulgare TaxID=112509 RepID=UPI001D1A53E7|nr:uncharacterized protein LOC123405968 [Hordeum vulgare subsp. vulgare]
MAPALPSLEHPPATGQDAASPDPPRHSSSRTRPALGLPRHRSSCTSFPVASNSLTWWALLIGAADSDPIPFFTPAIVAPTRAMASLRARQCAAPGPMTMKWRRSPGTGLLFLSVCSSRLLYVIREDCFFMRASFV